MGNQLYLWAIRALIYWFYIKNDGASYSTHTVRKIDSFSKQGSK